MLRIVRITGDSLTPTLKEGEYVVLTTCPFFFRWIKPGMVIVFNHPAYGQLVKRVITISADKNYLTVAGNHPESVDSRSFGFVRMEDVEGFVLWEIKDPSRS